MLLCIININVARDITDACHGAIMQAAEAARAAELKAEAEKQANVESQAALVSELEERNRAIAGEFRLQLCLTFFACSVNTTGAFEDHP